MHADLHWLDVPQRVLVKYKLCMQSHNLGPAKFGGLATICGRGAVPAGPRVEPPVMLARPHHCMLTDRCPCAADARSPPDLRNILRQSYDYLTIMPKLRSTYDGRLVYETSYEERKDFLMCNSLAKS